MRIVVYEFVTGGGWHHVAAEAPPESLLDEGRAMLRAIAADLVALEGAPAETLHVQTLHDARQVPPDLAGLSSTSIHSAEQELETLARLSARADWTLLIAPEFDQHLLSRVRLVERAGGRLLGPSSQLVALAGDKQTTAEHLARHGVPVASGVAIPPGEPLPDEFDYPAVLKPRDGAGSLGIEWAINSRHSRRTPQVTARLERFCPGLPASVACLCGPEEIVPLEPCGQRLRGDGDFSYLGGWLPLDAPLAARARRLALRTMQALPEPRGYVGVDLVLGSDPAGSGDVVVEVNPRLTTSYVGLRVLSRVNLAAAMIAVAQSREAQLCWNRDNIAFTSSGPCPPLDCT